MELGTKDRTILRDLARKVADIAQLPIMAERRSMWKRHHALQRVRPMILVFPEGAWRELMPPSALQCEGQPARNIESGLRTRIYGHEHFRDDMVIDNEFGVGKWTRNSGWGLQPRHVPSSQAVTGAYGFDPVVKTPADLKKLRVPVLEYDEAATLQNLKEFQDLFGDILNVRLRGVCHVSFHLMYYYTQLRGLEQVMADMTENPAMLHDAIAFLEEGHHHIVRQYIEQNLLDLNNDGTYHSSGGIGYTDELPRPGYDPKRIRPADMWSSAQAQELAQVSPDMHYEFVMQYEKRLLAPFGLNGYGCCEDLTRKLDYVFTIPNIRRISISSWSDVDVCGQKLGNKYIFSWKPAPWSLVGDFDKAKLREYIKRTLEATKGGIVEMILKDTHTCENHPERFDQWTEIARELAEAY